MQDRGYLSGLIIDETERLPSSSAYQSRFGSLLRAYELVGFTPDRDYRYIEINRALRRMHPNIVADVIAGIEQAGGSVKQDPATDLLTVNGEFTASIVVVRCQTTAAGSLRWQIRFDIGLWPDITVAVRMDGPNQNALDYYLLPRIDMTAPRLRLAEDNGISLDAYRFATLDAFFGLGDTGKPSGGCMNDPADDYRVETIPIERIDVINPRVRNKKIFKEIVSNIAELGLKRPITVTRRDGTDGPRYALVCGQGRA